MMYLQASIKLYPGKQQEFVKLLNDLMPSLNKHGWKLVGSFAAAVGRLNSAVDLWEVPNAEAVTALLSDPEFAKSGPRIAEIVEDEVLTLLTKLPIG
ncbi:MAG TPA: NIPSNAP family protein [Candidatus Binataceae bacterium]|nr:NIPSNAP family protein [Candidatus Binataceae bacterium]